VLRQLRSPSLGAALWFSVGFTVLVWGGVVVGFCEGLFSYFAFSPPLVSAISLIVRFLGAFRCFVFEVVSCICLRRFYCFHRFHIVAFFRFKVRFVAVLFIFCFYISYYFCCFLGIFLVVLMRFDGVCVHLCFSCSSFS